LAWIGYIIGDNQQLIMQISRQAAVWAIGSCLLLLGVYLYWQKKRNAN
jgi:uncharacterized membrane protein YfcA